MSDQNEAIEKERLEVSPNAEPTDQSDESCGASPEAPPEDSKADSARDGLLIKGMIAATILCLVVSLGAAGYQFISCWKSCKEVPVSEPAQALWGGIVSEKPENSGLGTGERLAAITKFKSKDPGAADVSPKKE